MRLTEKQIDGLWNKGSLAVMDVNGINMRHAAAYGSSFTVELPDGLMGLNELLINWKTGEVKGRFEFGAEHDLDVSPRKILQTALNAIEKKWGG